MHSQSMFEKTFYKKKVKKVIFLIVLTYLLNDTIFWWEFFDGLSNKEYKYNQLTLLNTPNSKKPAQKQTKLPLNWGPTGSTVYGIFIPRQYKQNLFT